MVVLQVCAIYLPIVMLPSTLKRVYGCECFFVLNFNNWHVIWSGIYPTWNSTNIDERGRCVRARVCTMCFCVSMCWRNVSVCWPRRRFDWENPTNLINGAACVQQILFYEREIKAWWAGKLRNVHTRWSNNGRDKTSEKPMTIESIFKPITLLFMIQSARATTTNEENKCNDF